MRYGIPLTALLILASGCGGDGGSNAPAPSTGSLQITTRTTGQPTSGDSYSYSLDGAPGGSIGLNEVVTVTDLSVGSHVLTLTDIPEGCTVSTNNPLTVSISADQTTLVAFDVVCVPPMGIIQVTVSTSGPAPDHYTILVDGQAQVTTGPSGTQSISVTAPADHTVGLSDVPANCSIQQENPQLVTVGAGATAPVLFTITCTAPPAQTGILSIAATTTGNDPDGYQVSVDGGPAQPLAVNGTLAIMNIAVGPHSVQLADLDAGCVLGSPNPQTVTVSSGATTTVSFAVNCTAPHSLLDLGTLPGGTESQATDIAPAGQVVGSSTLSGNSHAFLWDDGVMTDLGTLGGTFSRATSISPSGQVVGVTATEEQLGARSFLWSEGVMTDLGTLGGIAAEAQAINSNGQVVGFSVTAAGELHAFLWEEGVMTDLGTLGGQRSLAFAINSSGQVVGSSETADGATHAFLWNKGIMTDLGTLGGIGSEARGINSKGQVVGFLTTASGGLRAFLWERGIVSDLGTLGGSGAAARDINDAGQVVGFAETGEGQIHAFIWTDGVMTDLGTLGGDRSDAYAIDPAGEIVGESRTAGGEFHATLWTRR